jgi:ferrous iron transport protein A
MTLKLNQLEVDIIATIKKVETSIFSEKLLEMGCTPGTKIKKSFTAPTGDPVVYMVGDYFLSMRKAEAETIVIELENSNK